MGQNFALQDVYVEIHCPPVF